MLFQTIKWAIFWSGLGVLLFSFAGFTEGKWSIYGKMNQQLSSMAVGSSEDVGAKQVMNRVPVRIELVDQGIDLEVVPGRIINGQWEVSEVTANYLVGSGVTGANGNVVIYGHKRPHIFGKLSKIQTGQTVRVESQDVIANYKVNEIKIVGPQNVGVLDPGEKAELTIYTCNGWKDEDRLVVKAVLVEEKIKGFGGLMVE